ncbi:Isochorismatase hydrolase [Pisolithus sp. B1]|nr:Isochorismatase hydrolase [Pisolithus sp. B1]
MSQPVYDMPIYSVIGRPRVSGAVECGNAASFWVEYPSGLVNFSRSQHVAGHSHIAVDGDRIIRIDQAAAAVTIIDVQKVHFTGLKCVDPWLMVLPVLRQLGVKVLWVNWGLTDHDLETIRPSVVRGFSRHGEGGFGSALPGSFGRLLVRREYNSELYGPLNIWIHKNIISGLWGHQSALGPYLQENGITTLLIGGCVGGTLVDAYFRGYDCARGLESVI